MMSGDIGRVEEELEIRIATKHVLAVDQTCVPPGPHQAEAGVLGAIGCALGWLGRRRGLGTRSQNDGSLRTNRGCVAIVAERTVESRR